MWVIGWVTAEKPMPGIFTVPVGTLHVLVAHEVPDSTRAKLAKLQQLFKAGLDFVPLAPTQHTTLQDAITYTEQHNESIVQQISALYRKGQFTLTLAAPMRDGVPRHTGTGRSWLRGRIQSQHQNDEAYSLLTRLAEGYLSRQTQAKNAVRCDVLVPRHDVTTVIERIKKDAPAFPQHRKLTVSGLWVPLSFAGQHLHQGAHA